MKKNEVKKLRLSRETLQILQSSDTQKVVGGIAIGSTQSECCPSVRTDVC
jgi:hypothetical protein